MYRNRSLFSLSHHATFFALAVVGFVLSFFLFTSPTYAATCNYIGPAYGDWHTSGNWDCGVVPTAVDDAILPPAATVSGTTAWINPKSLTVGGGAILQAVGQQIRVANGMTTNAGTIQGDGVMQFTQGLNNSGMIYETGIGDVSFGGPVTNGGVITTSVAGNSALFADTWTNTGVFDSYFYLRFTGSIDQSIPASVSQVYALGIQKLSGSTLTLQGNLELTNGVEGLVMDGGGSSIFDLGGFTLTNDADRFIIKVNSTIRNGTQILQPTLGTASIEFDSGVSMNIDMVASSTGAITLVPSPLTASFDLYGDLTVATSTTISFPSTSYFTVENQVFNHGTINNDGKIAFNSTTTNTGTLGSGGSGNVGFNGPVVSSGAINVGSAYVDFFDTWDNSGGSINAGANVEIFVNSDMTFPGGILVNSINFDPTGTPLARVTLGGNVTSTNAVTMQGNGILDLGGNTLYTMSFSKNYGTFDPNSGTIEIIGAGSSERLYNVDSLYDLRINTTGASDLAILRGDTTIAGQLRILSGILKLSPTNVSSLIFSGSGTGGSSPIQAGSGEFIASSGTVKFTGTATTDIKGLNFYHLQALGATTYNITASTTVMGDLTLGSGTTLAMAGNDMTVLGSIVNPGLMTVGAGTILHPAESVLFADAFGTELTLVHPGDKLYIRVQDSDQNMDGTLVESFTVTVNSTVAMGNDSETVTLTETGPATGIFTSLTPLTVQIFDHGIVGDGLFEFSADGNARLTYTDPDDITDSKVDYVALTTTPVTGSAPAHSGGGGGGIPAPVTTFQSSTTGVTNDTGLPTHALVKLVDDGNSSTQADTAVYYIGADGKRHAFPNERVYFSWYSDFSGVQILNRDQLSSIVLGKNVSYKPGVRMVKFTTDPKVYAVDRGGVLRWITSESVAEQLYGANWNQKIDDISDAFYTDYRFGTDIVSVADYDLSIVMSGTQYPSDSF